MTEYHLWVTIVSKEISDASSKRVIGTSDLDEIRTLVRVKKDFFSSFHFAKINGLDFLMGGGQSNHRGSVVDDLVSLLVEIADVAPDSYGLLYVRDDEDQRGYQNEFRVWRLVKEKVEECDDKLLSPCIPVIES